MKKQGTKKTPAKAKKPPPELNKLSARIKELRKNKGYKSHEAFAYDIGISRSQYNKYERGYDIRFTTLVRIIKELNMSIDEFFSEGFD